MTIYVDHTHLGRHVSGLERITLELFSPAALSPLDPVPITARGRLQMVMRQTFGLPARMARRGAILLCPGFPPSPLLYPFSARVIPYIHDMFLMSRRRDLNARALLYMAQPFRLAVQSYRRFLVNSQDTAAKLSKHCRSDAEITLYRPHVRNVFNLHPADRAERPAAPQTLRLIAVGTVEPRKNFVLAARIVAALRQNGFPDATLDIVGRKGWGPDWDELARMPGITLHGYLTAERATELLRAADALICTSHEEGLGLPLLEAQYAGLPIVAPYDTIFREVLGASGIFITRDDASAAAKSIAAALAADHWRRAYVDAGSRNIARWNALADADRAAVIRLIAKVAQSDNRSSSARAVAKPLR
jgi:glycosyltransferase involved in cell wall biosynthesis